MVVCVRNEGAGRQGEPKKSHRIPIVDAFQAEVGPAGSRRDSSGRAERGPSGPLPGRSAPGRSGGSPGRFDSPTTDVPRDSRIPASPHHAPTRPHRVTRTWLFLEVTP